MSSQIHGSRMLKYESKVLSKLSHENIVKYHDDFVENPYCCLVMEFAKYGDLYTMLNEHCEEKEYMEELDIMRIFTQVA